MIQMWIETISTISISLSYTQWLNTTEPWAVFTQRSGTRLHTQSASPYWSYKTLELKTKENKSINSKFLKPVIYLWSSRVLFSSSSARHQLGFLIGVGYHLQNVSHRPWCGLSPPECLTQALEVSVWLPHRLVLWAKRTRISRDRNEK